MWTRPNPRTYLKSPLVSNPEFRAGSHDPPRPSGDGADQKTGRESFFAGDRIAVVLPAGKDRAPRVQKKSGKQLFDFGFFSGGLKGRG